MQFDRLSIFVTFFSLVLQWHNSRYLLVEIDGGVGQHTLREKWNPDNVVLQTNGLSCWVCPFTSTGNDKCLVDGSQFGKSMGCYSVENACLTLIVDDNTAPIRYNRRCGESNLEDGCVKVNLTLAGITYPGRACSCTTGDNCNTKV